MPRVLVENTAVTKTVNIGDSDKIGDINIEISQLQYRAFGTTAKDNFSSTGTAIFKSTNVIAFIFLSLVSFMEVKKHWMGEI